MTVVPVAVLAMGGIDTWWSRVLQWLLATPVLFVFGWQFHRTAVLRARSFDANMDTLVALGTVAAYLFSVWSFFRGDDLYFETASIIISDADGNNFWGVEVIPDPANPGEVLILASDRDYGLFIFRDP